MTEILRYIIINYFMTSHLANDLDQNKAKGYLLINLKWKEKIMAHGDC